MQTAVRARETAVRARETAVRARVAANSRVRRWPWPNAWLNAGLPAPHQPDPAGGPDQREAQTWAETAGDTDRGRGRAKRETETSEAVPKPFGGGSEVAPRRRGSESGTETVPRQFRGGSEAVPKQFRGGAVLGRFRGGAVPVRFRSRSDAIRAGGIFARTVVPCRPYPSIRARRILKAVSNNNARVRREPRCARDARARRVPAGRAPSVARHGRHVRRVRAPRHAPARAFPIP